MVIESMLKDMLLLLLVWQIVSHWSIFQDCRRYRGKKSKKKSSSGSKTRTGLTKKPPCRACERSEGQSGSPVPSPPPLIEHKRGRPAEVETDKHYCPNTAGGCAYYGWTGRGNIRANGHPNGGPWRQLQCTICGQYFMETEGTIFFGKGEVAETMVRAIACLAEGTGIRAVARIFEVDPNTVLAWLIEAAEQMEALSGYLLHDLQISQVQMDELYALLSQIKADDLSQEAVLGHVQRPHHWVWAAIDPVSKLLLAVVVGDRSLSMAQLLVHLVAQVLTPGVLPLFVTDGLTHYSTALLTHFGHWVTLPRRGSRGPHPKPRWLPLPELLYAQVVKKRVKGRVVAVTSWVVYGSAEVIQETLAQLGWQINTAFIERANRTFRQHISALARRTASLAKTDQGLRRQTLLWWGYYNFCLPHTTLRLLLSQPQPTKGSGSPKKWQPRTPAMAAGITDHVCSLQEVLLFRLPPWRQAVVL